MEKNLARYDFDWGNRDQVFEFECWNEDTRFSRVTVDLRTLRITNENFTNTKQSFLFEVFGKCPIEMEYLVRFWRSRCIPETQDGVEDFLEHNAVAIYDPKEIILVTRGVMNGDNTWLRIGNEQLDWETVKRLKAV